MKLYTLTKEEIIKKYLELEKENEELKRKKEALEKEKPFLGICLGMQLLFTNSAEANLPQTFTDCLNLIPGQVKKFETNLKVPQIGWNQVTAKSNSKLLTGIKAESYFYFVHSYYCQLTDSNISFGKTNYDQNFCSLIETKNIYGVQFHPEKSSQVGLQLLQNFGRLVC